MAVKRSVFVYAAAMVALLLLLKLIEYQYLIRALDVEIYLSIVAFLFASLGLWAGWKLTKGRRPEVVTVAAGTIDPGASERLGLSEREVEVLRLIAQGHSNQEIADKLFLSLNTIKKHTSSLFTKLEVSRRTQAVERAKRERIIG